MEHAVDVDRYYCNIIKIHSSYCEIKDIVEAHICKLCVILRLRILLGVCVHIKELARSATPLRTSLYQGQQGEVNQLAQGNDKTPF